MNLLSSVVLAPTPRIKKRILTFQIISLILLTVAVRLVLLFPERNLSPDAIDYLNIARNLAKDRGFVQSIKWNFFTDSPVVHSAVAERPPLYPILVSFILRQEGELLSVDLLNVFLGACGVAALFLLYRMILQGGWLAFLAAVLVAVNPSMARSAVYPWTEPLFILLQTLTFLFILLGTERLAWCDERVTTRNKAKAEQLRAKYQKRGEYYILAAGFVAAMAYLARPSALALIAAIFLALGLRRQWRALGLFLLPCGAVLAIWFGVVGMVHGNPFYSVQAHHSRVVSIEDGMRKGWGVVIPSAAEFRQTHSIVRLIATSTGQYAMDLFFLFLWWTVLGLIAVPAMIRRRGVAILGLAGLLHFALAAVVWSTHEPDRLLQPAFVCLLPLCLGAPFAIWKWSMARRQAGPELHRVLRISTGVVVVAICCVWGVMNGIDIKRWHSRMQGFPEILPLEHEQVVWNRQLPEDYVIASDDPFICNWRVDRPTVYLPETLNADNAENFLRQFSVRLIAVLSSQDPKSQEAIAVLQQRGLVQPLSRGFDPFFRWFLVNESIFLSPGSKPTK